MLTGPLARADIAQRIPHAGAMCLLDSLLSADEHGVHCRIINHTDPAHPLRSASGLLSVCAIEYAAQAMALHAALADEAGGTPRPGFLASARTVRLLVDRLDDQRGSLQIGITRVATGGDQALYRFELHNAEQQLLVEGRAAVVLNTPLIAPTTEPLT